MFTTGSYLIPVYGGSLASGGSASGVFIVRLVKKPAFDAIQTLFIEM
jgi:hypothetical protein